MIVPLGNLAAEWAHIFEDTLHKQYSELKVSIWTILFNVEFIGSYSLITIKFQFVLLTFIRKLVRYDFIQ